MIFAVMFRAKNLYGFVGSKTCSYGICAHAFFIPQRTLNKIYGVVNVLYIAVDNQIYDYSIFISKNYAVTCGLNHFINVFHYRTG
ncbi:hypothetical protein SDC9_138771 [bioreactor metagenome]|uniref:Uncharacterized protein n=1 Tax=bioreactor metagenome TaxID=1076179 RepID=A0A645DQ79_9ZZZZ